MNEPRKLIAESSEIERLLLDAGSSEEPSAQTVRRAAAALGLTVATSAGSATAAHAATSLFSSAWSKVAVVAIGAAGGLGLYAAESSPSAVLRPAAPALADRASEFVSRAAPPIIPTATEPATPVDSVTAVPARQPPAPPNEAKVTALKEQVAVIDAARRSLASGQVQEALVRLDHYDRTYRRGALRQESALLRVEALVRAGKRQEALRLARRLVSTTPNSPHQRRLETLVGQPLK